MKKQIIAICLASILILSNFSALSISSFKDVDEQNLYFTAVEELKKRGVIDGYDDGTFLPEKTVTRAEFSKFLVVFMGYSIPYSDDVDTVFYDVNHPKHWAAKYIKVSNELGIISGYEDGSFRPENEVLFEEALKMTECAFGYEKTVRDLSNAKNIPFWPDAFIDLASSFGLDKNTNSDKGSVLTRGRVAMILYNAINLSFKTESEATINYLLPSDPGTTFSDDQWIFQNWGKKAGVKIKLISIPRDAFDVKLAALFASNLLPDVINYYNDANTKYYKKYGSNQFVALDDYLEAGQLPNYKRWLDKYGDVRKASKNPMDGKIYGFSFIQDFEAFDVAWSIRNDILKKGGMDASQIKTIDDLKNALLILKNQSGQKYIVSHRLGWRYFGDYAAKFFGTYTNMMFDNKLDNGTNQFIYAPAYSQYKVFIEFMNWMYVNEILHPEFNIMEQMEYMTKMSDGSILMRMEQGTLSLPLKANAPNRDEKVIFPVSINGVTPKQSRFPHQNNGFRYPVTISKTASDISAAMRMMDFIYSDEGITDNFYGEEGVHWVKDENYIDGIRVTGKKGRSTFNLVNEGILSEEAYDRLPTNAVLGNLGSYWIMGVITQNNRFSLTDLSKDDYENEPIFKHIITSMQYGISNGYTTEADPVVDLSEWQTNEAAAIINYLDSYVQDTSMKFIVGLKPLSEWGSFVAELERMEYKRLESIFNDAYEAQN